MGNFTPTQEDKERRRIIEIAKMRAEALKNPEFRRAYAYILGENPKMYLEFQKLFDSKWIHEKYDSDNVLENDIRSLWVDLIKKQEKKIIDSRPNGGYADPIDERVRIILENHLREMDIIRSGVPDPNFVASQRLGEEDIFSSKFIVPDDPEAVKRAKRESRKKKNTNLGESLKENIDVLMAAEDTPTDRLEGLNRGRYQDTHWVSTKSTLKPAIGEKTQVCGYIYKGVIEYCVGVYTGDNDWDTPFNDGYMPDFNVLYWRTIPVIEGVEEEC